MVRETQTKADSTYLLHGILLFTLFHFAMDESFVRNLSPLQYCLLIFMITPLVVVVSYVAFKYIEEPFMKKGK
jgi:peptidoglycan/LPS O-acetylase OafA/YrhL